MVNTVDMSGFPWLDACVPNSKAIKTPIMPYSEVLTLQVAYGYACGYFTTFEWLGS